MQARSHLQSHSHRFHLVLAVLVIAGLSLPASAFGYHPETSQMRVVQTVAHDLEDAARRVHRLAERTEHHYDRREQRALRALHELEKAADDFHRQVERHRQNPYRTERAFETLNRSYFAAYRAFFGLHAFRRVETAFQRVDELMEDLRYYYTEPRHGHNGGRSDGHRYERGDRGYRGHGEYRGQGEVRRYGQYRGYGRYRGSSAPPSHTHYDGCGHDGH